MKEKLSTSVVMTTYNGSKFVIEQLQSLLNQDRKIDEVLIFDDHSKDDTVSIVQRFIDQNDLKHWSITINAEQYGWKKNFYQGMLLANCDVIFTCDQDDIWYPYKIDDMTRILENDSKIMVVEGQFEKYFMGESKKSISNSLDRISDLLSNKKDSGNVKIRHFGADFMRLAPGCCMCVRRTFLHKIKNYWHPVFGHDAYITFYSLVEDCYAVFEKPVIKWRHYTGSTSRPKTKVDDIRLKELDRNDIVIEYIEKYLKDTNNSNTKIINVLNKSKKISNDRRKLIITGNITLGIKNIFNIRYYERSRSYITDFKYAIKNKSL